MLFRSGISAGMTLIDTAEMYGNGKAESLIKEVISDKKRDDLFLVSKVLPNNAGKHRLPMAKKETASPAIPVFPMLKTVEQMSKVSGIGENKLRELMDSGELEYIQNGNRRLIADAAIWDWYHRAKKTAKPPARQGG